MYISYVQFYTLSLPIGNGNDADVTAGSTIVILIWNECCSCLKRKKMYVILLLKGYIYGTSYMFNINTSNI